MAIFIFGVIFIFGFIFIFAFVFFFEMPEGKSWKNRGGGGGILIMIKLVVTTLLPVNRIMATDCKAADCANFVSPISTFILDQKNFCEPNIFVHNLTWENKFSKRPCRIVCVNLQERKTTICRGSDIISCVLAAIWVFLTLVSLTPWHCSMGL